MTAKLFGAPVTLLVIGCLLIVMSDRPSSWRAVVGFVCLALALLGAVLAFAKRRVEPAVISLTVSEKESLRGELNSEGLVSAARQQRSEHPEVTLTQAKHTLDTL